MMTSSNNNSTNSITANATVSMQHQRQTQQQQQQQRQQLMGLNICVMILCLMVVALTVSNVGVEHMTTRMIQEIQQQRPPSVDVNVIIETMLSLLLVVPISSSSV